MEMYTCFKDRRVDASALHLTHKYLGEVNYKSEIREIIKLVAKTACLQEVHTLWVDYSMDNLTHFGKDKDVPVYSFPDLKFEPSFVRLRKSLDKFRKDDFKPYIPHITITPYLDNLPKKAALCLDEYCLYGNGKIFLRIPLIQQPYCTA